MTATTPPLSTPDAPGRPRRRKRRWLRWTIAVLIALVLLAVGLVAAAVKLQPVPAPLALPAGAAAPSGPLDGVYRPAAGSSAGFRVEQTVIGLTSEVVGRTEDVTGTVTVAGGRVTAAQLRIGLRALTAGGAEPAPQFGISLDTAQHPDAILALTEPLTPGAGFPSGTPVTATAAGTLALHGVTRPVTAALTLRRDGPGIGVAGSLPVAFADYAIPGPEGYGPFGSLADHGLAEFRLVLRRT
ncbi:hypothetical protein GCM10020358_33990 [Amorphoplanes nipponensis]|uniref:Lipid/polyisoprenoid-binding YceI-like domain-containing protein n=1 Tax=Actinoplanes nipponensis TaxID=135950 RepID=A0A919JGJ2_9ACTN|nr:YceI family protein [Actinoplanes nipponensis]GIE49097.1 hypothetical protein Ani05nite_26310 [Actinoplanes nipponensis]